MVKTNRREEKVPAVEKVKTAEPAEAEKPAEIAVEAKKKILFVASEAAPSIATGGLAEVFPKRSQRTTATTCA